MWVKELDKFTKFSIKFNVPALAPNSMNNYGVLLDDIAYDKMITSLIN